MNLFKIMITVKEMDDGFVIASKELDTGLIELLSESLDWFSAIYEYKRIIKNMEEDLFFQKSSGTWAPSNRTIFTIFEAIKNVYEV